MMAQNTATHGFSHTIEDEKYSMHEKFEHHEIGDEASSGASKNDLEKRVSRQGSADAEVNDEEYYVTAKTWIVVVVWWSPQSLCSRSDRL